MTTTQQMAQEAQVLISPDDFADDLANLGSVNGNILHRIPSVPGVHDGQLLVRLKKKRFVLLDYSIRPNDVDLEQAAMHAHIKIPKSVGKLCSKKECHKVGVPVCLYDSHPSEPDPLFLRNGLCFQCQRNLNEKRRDKKKKKGKDARQGEGDDNDDNNNATGATMADSSSEPNQKKFKRHNDSNNNAASLGSNLEGTRQWTYSSKDVGTDLVASTQEAAQDVARLVHGAAAAAATAAGGYQLPYGGSMSLNHHGIAESMPSSFIGASTATLYAIATATEVSNKSNDPHVIAATAAAITPHGAAWVAKSADDYMSEQPQQQQPPSTDEINALYSKTFHSLHKSLYLLSQWKVSWDAATGQAAPSAVPPPPPQQAVHDTITNLTSLDPSIMLMHDAVASAAAVAAMTAAPPPLSIPPAAAHPNPPPPPPPPPPPTNNSTNIGSDWPDTLASLLLAADQSNDHYISGSASEAHHEHDRVADWHFQHGRTGRDDDHDDASDSGVGDFDDV